MKITDKIQLLERVRTLEGLTPDEREALIALINENKTYGLVWENKPEAVEKRLENEYPVLTEVPERAIISDNPEAPNHILIEGDNLEALTTLSYTHEGKIDVIYIDPPYNTGNKDFIYNDSYIDKDDAYRHSKWLSFMHKRLVIAKNLLSENGVIFISLDDNEQSQLRLLCDEIFNPKNFCGNIIWRKKSGGGQTDTFFVTEHEYILVYQKTDQFKWIDPSEPISEKSFKFQDSKGNYKLTPLEKWGSSAHKEDRPSMYFPIKNEQGLDYFPIAPDGKAGRWRVGTERMNRLIKDKDIEWKNNRPMEKTYYSSVSDKQKIDKTRSIYYTIGETGEGTKLLTEIFSTKDVFGNPKPLNLIKDLISHNDAEFILDFFAGSGTTLHATMQLNAEDGGKRTCILCTNNENGICENVTYERNKRVIEGYTKPNGDFVEGLHDNNLRYYRTDFVSRERTQKNRKELMEKSTDLLCIKEDLYTEKNTFGKIKLLKEGARYFENEHKRMLVIYQEELIPYFMDEIDRMDVTEPIKVFVYARGRYAYDDEFAIVAEKVSLCALPQAIIDAMARVMPENETEKAQEPETSTSTETTITEEPDSLFANLED